MQTKNIIISAIIGIIIIAGAFFAVFGSSLKNLSQDTDVQVAAPVADTPKMPTTPAAPAATGKTMADVAMHNSASSCWSAINGQVYDLTNWVNAHPGGKASILMICGKDGSPLFNAQHGGDRRPATILEKYLIGSLN